MTLQVSSGSRSERGSKVMSSESAWSKEYADHQKYTDTCTGERSLARLMFEDRCKN